MKIIDVKHATDSYSIYIKNGLLSEISQMITPIYTGKKIVIITDETVENLYGASLQKILSDDFHINFITIKSGEESKHIKNIPQIYSQMLAANISRNDLLIAFGGGVVGDLAGFIAATYLRGIKFIQIPTTLLAQVDSSVGGKVAVNLDEGKNLVGAFYNPVAVFIDTHLLHSLTDITFSEGMAEVIKYACILDSHFFEILTQLKTRANTMQIIDEIVETCCNHKRNVVIQDPLDNGRRLLLNFGHTLAHAIETIEKIPHGLAVAIGMYQTSLLSENQSLTKKGTTKKLKILLLQHGLPTEFSSINKMAYEKAMQHDKKNSSSILKEIILNEIGDSYIFETTSDFYINLFTKNH